MDFALRLKVVLFLLFSSAFGGFFLATKLTEYFFEKTQAKGGGGGGNQKEREGKERKQGGGNVAGDEEGNKQGGAGNPEDKDGQDGEGDGQFPGGLITDRAAMRFLVANTIRKNPGPHTPQYTYLAGRGLLGEGTPERFGIRTWVWRDDRLCQTTPKGGLDCFTVKVVVGKPANGGPDVELSPLQVQQLLKTAELLKKKRAEEADRQPARPDMTRAPPVPVDDSVLMLDFDPDRPPVDGEQIATLIIEERAFPIIKGNMLGFPGYIPSVDDPKDAPSTETDKNATVAPAAVAKPEPKKPVAATAPKPPEPKRAGFSDPAVRPVGFASPQAPDRRSFQPVAQANAPAPQAPDPTIGAPNPSQAAQTGATGKDAWDRIIHRELLPLGAQPAKLPLYLGFLDSGGKFLQLTRDPLKPFESVLSMGEWSWRDDRVCITGQLLPAQAARRDQRDNKRTNANAAPAARRVGTACISPVLGANGETNVGNFRGERLMIGASPAMLTQQAVARPEAPRTGRPTGFQNVSPASPRPAGSDATATGNSPRGARI